MSLPVTIATWIFVPILIFILGGLLWVGLIAPLIKSMKPKKKKEEECQSCKLMDPTMTFCSVCGGKLR